MKLYVARHSYAGPSVTDPKAERERQLLPEGIKIAKAIAAVMDTLGEIPNAIFCSPFMRAVQTADIYGKAWGVQVNVVGDFAPMRPLTPVLERFIGTTGKEKLKRLMIVGHVDNSTPAFRDLGQDGEDWDPLVMGEIRRLRIDRRSLDWDIRWQIRPSDLGLTDHDK